MGHVLFYSHESKKLFTLGYVPKLSSRETEEKLFTEV